MSTKISDLLSGESHCCNAPILADICTECGEHCQDASNLCPDCGGDGMVADGPENTMPCHCQKDEDMETLMDDDS